MSKKEEVFCSWCGSPCDHEGAIQTPNGELRGFFCDEKHFKLWAKWKTAFLFYLSKPEAIGSET